MLNDFVSGRLLRLVIADTHALIREGLIALLSAAPDLKIVGEAADGRTAVNVTRQLQPDVLITDLLLPRMNGIDAIEEIVSRKLATRILVLTADRSERCVRTALRVGAAGYILKTCKFAELQLAIRSISEGNAYLSPSISSNVIHGYVNTSTEQVSDSKWSTLTSRERQVLQQIAEGGRNRDIAEQLHISIKTVEKHRSNLRQKLDIHNTHGLISYWEIHGLSPDTNRLRRRGDHEVRRRSDDASSPTLQQRREILGFST